MPHSPPFSFSYDFVSMSPNHLAPRMVALPFCLLSPPDTGSLRSFVQEKGQGQGLGEGKVLEVCGCLVGRPRWHLHSISSNPLKIRHLLCVWLQDQKTSPYLPLFLFEGTVARC